MRIISKFKDYYDFPQKWGFDPKIVYNRKTFIERKGRYKIDFPPRIDTDPEKYYQKKYTRNNNRWYEKGYYDAYESLFLGFAGEIHKIFVTQMGGWGKTIPVYITQEELDSIQDRVYEEIKRQGKLDPVYYHNKNEPQWGESKEKEIDYTPMFEKAPVFIHYVDRNDSVTCYNPNLSELNLTFVYDGLTAYQKLSQYMSNVWAINQMPIPVPSDRDMVEIKGFDKYSFRKDKEE